MNLRNISVTHVVGDPRLVSELRPLLAGAGASRFSSVIVLCDITWTVCMHRVGLDSDLGSGGPHPVCSRDMTLNPDLGPQILSQKVTHTAWTVYAHDPGCRE